MATLIIYNENYIGRMRDWSILNACWPKSRCGILDCVVKVFAHIGNMLSDPERQLKNKVLISHFHLTLNHCTYIMHVSSTLQRVSRGGELPYMVVIGMCSSQGDSF